jgi:hypothetical protein
MLDRDPQGWIAKQANYRQEEGVNRTLQQESPIDPHPTASKLPNTTTPQYTGPQDGIEPTERKGFIQRQKEILALKARERLDAKMDEGISGYQKPAAEPIGLESPKVPSAPMARRPEAQLKAPELPRMRPIPKFK